MSSHLPPPTPPHMPPHTTPLMPLMPPRLPLQAPAQDPAPGPIPSSTATPTAAPTASPNATPNPAALGPPGQPWGEAERQAWRAGLRRQRSHAHDVVRHIDGWRARFEVLDYGELVQDGARYPLTALRSRAWRAGLPAVLVTGGVHGYETSGVHGALRFLDQHAEAYDGRVNGLVVPCVSPWAYERVQRWNRDAVDPNRSFREPSPAPEAAALMGLLRQLGVAWTAHIDLHETTDSDETEFRPAKAARDGELFEPGRIPDGFYLVDDTEHPQPAFQQAIIDAVQRMTHIAPADAAGRIIDGVAVAHGVIRYPLKALGLCAGVTGARYTSTTEVYPDSPRATAEQCNQAQATAVCAAFDFVLRQAAAPAA